MINHIKKNQRELTFVSLFVLSAMFTGNIFSDDFSKYNNDEVITHVMETYSRVYSATGRITRTVEADGAKRSNTGKFTVKKPDRLYVEYVGEDHQITVHDGKTLRIFFAEHNKGIYKNTEDMIPMERFILGPEPFFGNVLQLMGKEFTIKLADMTSGNLILKAEPEKPLQLNFILIAINPENWTIQAIEYFDTTNKLVSQTRYYEFKSEGDSLYFPTKTITSTIIQDKLLVETLELSRVQLNYKFNDDIFSVPGNKETEWVLQEDNQ
ncbi:MAG: hypothetical protein JXB48_15200 [Candidatus Latescibacteria bacterium]|nr:hypothetical protein [Candidatus Latescibacterota bacterium]